MEDGACWCLGPRRPNLLMLAVGRKAASGRLCSAAMVLVLAVEESQLTEDGVLEVEPLEPTGSARLLSARSPAAAAAAPGNTSSY